MAVLSQHVRTCHTGVQALTPVEAPHACTSLRMVLSTAPAAVEDGTLRCIWAQVLVLLVRCVCPLNIVCQRSLRMAAHEKGGQARNIGRAKDTVTNCTDYRYGSTAL